MAREAGRQRGRLYRDIDVSPRNAWLALGVEAKVLEAGGTTVGRGSVGATAGRGSVRQRAGRGRVSIASSR